MELEQRSIDGLVGYIQERLNAGQHLTICGSNGGDGVYYHLAVGGGTWGHGEIYISFTNHGYCDRPDQFNPYEDSITVEVY